jgi:hypothetical protein
MNITHIRSVELIFNIPQDKIRIVAIPDNERKVLHQYLEQQYPKLPKTSLVSQRFGSEPLYVYTKCHECGYKNVAINSGNNTQSYDSEYKSGRCPQCDEYVWFDPNYDDWDEIHVIRKNNIIVMGSWFQGYSKPIHAQPGDVSIDKVHNILAGKIIYEISAPTDRLDKNGITKYIDDNLSTQDSGLYQVEY